MSFVQVRAQAVTLEKQTDALLSKFSLFQSTSATSALDEEAEIDLSINELISKREAVIGSLVQISELNLSLSTSKLQQLQRHKEILTEHTNNYRKIKDAINATRNRNNLLFSVRSDIDAHKQRTTATNNGQTSAEQANNYINDERSRVDNANSFADRLLQQAYNTRDELYQQRAYLNNAQQSMMGTIQSIPGINVLISKINTRKKRDTVIVATVISVCILFLFFF